MTDQLRKTAQDVLDAIGEDYDIVMSRATSRSITALEAALAETPSVDALIAEIESIITPELHNKNIYAILDKYRARGGA